jgi:hypothetical protein
MGRQHHVAAPLQHPELVGQCPWSLTQIRLGDDVEDHLAGGGHVDQLGAERPDPAADAEVDRAGAGDEPDIAGRDHPGAHGRGAEQSRKQTGHDKGTRSTELYRVFGTGLQSHASFPLAHEELDQTLQFLVA